VIQAGVATANARILSSRAFLKEMISEQWEVLSADETPTLDLRARLRLAMTYSMNQSREAVNFAFQAAGTNAIFETNPFERRMRDIHTLSAQGQSHTSNYEPVGEVFLGLDPSSHRV
jgi:alkylation response protein AidB-like acyl-CoA dehydrogenase